eukprot:5011846-Amphidinium_carterae.1
MEKKGCLPKNLSLASRKLIDYPLTCQHIPKVRTETVGSVQVQAVCIDSGTGRKEGRTQNRTRIGFPFVLPDRESSCSQSPSQLQYLYHQVILLPSTFLFLIESVSYSTAVLCNLGSDESFFAMSIPPHSCAKWSASCGIGRPTTGKQGAALSSRMLF